MKKAINKLNCSRTKKIATKPLILALLVLAVLVSTFSGCQQDNAPGGASGNAPGNASESSLDNASKDSSKDNSNNDATVKLTVAVQANPNIEDFNTNLYTIMVEQAMNVDLEFFELPSKADEAKTKIALMVSSGTALPDVINGVLDEVTAYDYASKGVLVKLDDYYNNPEIAPNFNNIPEEDRDFIFKNLKLPDGSVYSLPKYTPFAWNEANYRFWINSEWLEKLNLDIPSTIDEFYSVIKDFVEKDPNGNNKKDEIGIVGSKDGWAQNPIAYLMNSFIYANPDKDYFDIKDGKVVASFTQPEWKQGLEYMNKLVKDGLLSPLSFTQDQTQMKALINVKGGMAGTVAAGSYSTFGLNELENKMTLLSPLKGPKGVAYTPYNPTLPTHTWFITKNCQDPEFAFKVGDTMLAPELSSVSRLGEKGVDWTDDPEIVSQYIGEFEESEGIKPKYAILNTSFWGNPQNKSWLDAQPVYRSNEHGKLGAILKKDEPAQNNVVANFQSVFGKMYGPAFPKEVISKLSYTPEELKQIANSKTAIDAYVNDSAIAFITGE